MNTVKNIKKTSQIINIIHCERIRQNLSQEDLADIIGCTSRAVAYWETGKRTISLEAAHLALKTLGISIRIGKE